MQPSTSARTRVAGLRLPADLPPRDLERLADTPSSLAAPVSAPASFGLPGAQKFGGDGSPADVRVYQPNVAPLLMRGGVVSPGHGGGSGLVLPNLSLPLSGPTPSLPLPPVSRPLSAPAPEPSHSPVTGVSHHQAQSLPPTSAPRSGATPMPGVVKAQPMPVRSSSVQTGRMGGQANAPQLSQNEIKKAQNRKSAKRFREAQKQRWKNMADDLLIQKRTVSELRAQLAAQEACVARANAVIEGRLQLPKGDAKRSAMSINDLVESELPVTSPITPPPHHAHAEAEAALYAQILSNTTQKPPQETRPQPYVSELGLLTLSYVVVSSTTRVVSIRRGSPNSFGTFAVDGLNVTDSTEFRRALSCGKPVAVAYSRHGQRVNAVMNPVEGSDRVVVAEFSPLH